jgi:hypothetical protein
MLCLFDVRKSRCDALGFAIRPKAVFNFLSICPIAFAVFL